MARRAASLALALAAAPALAQRGNLAPPMVFPIPEVTLAPVPRPPAGGAFVATATVTLGPGSFMRLPGEAFEPLEAAGLPTSGVRWDWLELAPVRMGAPRGADRFPIVAGTFTIRFHGRLDPGVRRPGRPVVAVGGMMGLSGGRSAPLRTRLEGDWAPWTEPPQDPGPMGRLRIEARETLRVHLPDRERVLVGRDIDAALPAGTHRVLLDAPGRHPRLETVRIEPGRTATLAGELEAERPARVMLSVFPAGATVWEAGQVLGRPDPHLMLHLAPGLHVLELKLPGYQDRIVSLELRSGARHRLLHRLIPTAAP